MVSFNSIVCRIVHTWSTCSIHVYLLLENVIFKGVVPHSGETRTNFNTHFRDNKKNNIYIYTIDENVTNISQFIIWQDITRTVFTHKETIIPNLVTLSSYQYMITSGDRVVKNLHTRKGFVYYILLLAITFGLYLFVSKLKLFTLSALIRWVF